jgi:hypothetical protein
MPKTAKKNKTNKSTNSTTLKKRSKTDITKALFLEAFERAACNITLASKHTNIDRGTYYLWMEKDPKFKKAVEAHEASMVDIAESQLFKNLRDGKETSLFFYLCNKGKVRGWQSINKIETNVRVGDEIVIKLPEKFKDM